ncbi:hypothetical protein BCR44DRAFT_1442042 [Catenaria anguillulae PL171]|uniref:Uncharacterized protein n=1 Tax=Catenaria anguillulae PL171 TaxID=765915 RepID=A0A1Y2HAE7_9FUNG|nr:hypothetical protein BCR44DRAFT_1442042 [Catenaria anguillulae PL171]
MRSLARDGSWCWSQWCISFAHRDWCSATSWRDSHSTVHDQLAVIKLSIITQVR